MVLYAQDQSGAEALDALEGLDELFAPGAKEDAPAQFGDRWPDFGPGNRHPEVREYLRALVFGLAAHREEIDAAITAAAQNWRVDRMARIDRNVLRLGAYELLFASDSVPRNVVINEALELVKTFGDADAVPFVNGVLDRIGRDDEARG